MADILSAGGWSTNAHLMADVAALGWVGPKVLDLTYGLGNFWTNHTPEDLTTNDLHPDKGEHSIDVTGTLPSEWDAAFHTVVYDPPYRMSGKPDNPMVDTYGLEEYRPAKEIERLLRFGTGFARACTMPGGIFLVKCQNQQSNGKYIDQERTVIDAACGRGDDTEMLGRFLLLTKVRSQPKGRTQRTPRNNVSALLAFGRSGGSTDWRNQ